MDTKIIIGIPSPWTTRSDIVTSILQHSGGFIFAGLVLMDTVTKQQHSCHLGSFPRVPV
jgi:hypothetical protein